MKIAEIKNKLKTKASPKLDRRIDNLITNAEKKHPQESNTWSIIMKSKTTKLATAAVIIIAALAGIGVFNLDNATSVYAKAIQSVKEAGTFSCIARYGTLEQEKMFKEPDLMRCTYLSGVDEAFIGEVTIINYSQRQELVLNPISKTAFLWDKSSEYEINNNTGELELTQLDISLRDRMLSLRAKAVKDLGEENLNGDLIRKLQSTTDKQITTVWVDPESNLPVQIEINRQGKKIKYSSIKIDKDISDELFSLNPPDGYRLEKPTSGWPDEKVKIAAKIMYLIAKCAEFKAGNDGQYPNMLAKLQSVGLNADVLNVILSAPDSISDAAIIKYQKPRQGVDWSTEVIMHEIYSEWPEDGIVVGFADCHCELIANEQRFEELVR